MESAVLTGSSKKDMKLLLALADKLGIKARLFTQEEMEDLGLSIAIKEGRTGKFVDKDEFMKKLRA